MRLATGGFDCSRRVLRGVCMRISSHTVTAGAIAVNGHRLMLHPFARCNCFQLGQLIRRCEPTTLAHCGMPAILQRQLSPCCAPLGPRLTHTAGSCSVPSCLLLPGQEPSARACGLWSVATRKARCWWRLVIESDHFKKEKPHVYSNYQCRHCHRHHSR
jgi:hypothetical protein